MRSVNKLVQNVTGIELNTNLGFNVSNSADGDSSFGVQMASGMLGYYIGNEITIGGNKNWISGQTNFGTGDGAVSTGSGINGIGPYEFTQFSAMQDGVEVSNRVTNQLQWAKVLEYIVYGAFATIIIVLFVASLYFSGGFTLAYAPVIIFFIIGMFSNEDSYAIGVSTANSSCDFDIT